MSLKYKEILHYFALNFTQEICLLFITFLVIIIIVFIAYY